MNPYLATEEKIQEAVAALKEGKYTKVSHAARAFDVPYNRLNKRYSGRKSLYGRPSNNRKISEQQEQAICQYLDNLEKIGVSATRGMVTETANLVLRIAAHGEDLESPAVVSDMWTQRFLIRHPEYRMKNQNVTKAARDVAEQTAKEAKKEEKLAKQAEERWAKQAAKAEAAKQRAAEAVNQVGQWREEHVHEQATTDPRLLDGSYQHIQWVDS